MEFAIEARKVNMPIANMLTDRHEAHSIIRVAAHLQSAEQRPQAVRCATQGTPATTAAATLNLRWAGMVRIAADAG